MTDRNTRIEELRSKITPISPREAHTSDGVVLDVREPDEVSQGMPEGALHIVRGFLEMRVEEALPDKARPVHVMCASGVRSLFAAEALLALGYQSVTSISGGFQQWKQDQLPVAIPKLLDDASRERFSRHVLIPEVGEEGQLTLLNSSVLLVGAGGLGSPAAMYLAAAGVGRLGIVDDDVVDRSNLQRQILHGESRIGTPKVQSAARTIHELNPLAKVETHRTRLVADNVDEILAGYDVVVDGADNFATRYLVNDACVKHGLPNVHGSIYRFEGQVSVFWPARSGPCYRCVFPEPPPPALAPSCAEAGVLGVLPGVVGTLEAVEAIKLLLGIGEPLIGRLLHYDALAQRFSEMSLAANPDCAYCGEGREFPGYVDYSEFCSGS